MSSCAILAGMGAISLVSMVAEKIAISCGQQSSAQYIGLFSSATLGGTAVAATVSLINVIKSL